MSDRTGRNEPCPCGSGKKYKRCCLSKEPPKPLSTPASPSAWASPTQSPPAPGRASVAASPELPRPRDEWDDWFDRYRVSSLAGRLDRLRALLAEDHPPEFYTDIEFVSVVLEAPGDLDHEDDGAYIAFLEEMFASRADVFNLGADWFVREMAYACVRGGRDQEIARLLPPLLGDEHEPHEAVFDLEDLVRLAGRNEESRRLTFAMLKQTGRGGYLGWAIEELIEFAVFFLYREAIEGGCTLEARDQWRKQLARIECHPAEDTLTAMVAHRAGTAGRHFQRKDLLRHHEPAGLNLYLLSLDFGRWLTQERQMPPLVADTMRCFVYWCLGEMREKPDRNPLTLHQPRLDKYLAGLLGFMSLMRLRGVATLIGMGHFYDFLHSVNLIEEGDREVISRESTVNHDRKEVCGAGETHTIGDGRGRGRCRFGSAGGRLRDLRPRERRRRRWRWMHGGRRLPRGAGVRRWRVRGGAAGVHDGRRLPAGGGLSGRPVRNGGTRVHERCRLPGR